MDRGRERESGRNIKEEVFVNEHKMDSSFSIPQAIV